jgi:tRNA threonylcarbamoyladenosine biosynthesis protein TsaE
MHNFHYSTLTPPLFLADETATLLLGQQLAKCITAGKVIYLQGDLGAGKTTLTRGLLQGWGYSARVKSPTYTLVEPYLISGLYVYHFDLYRFMDPMEWEEAGFREYFHAQSVCVIEWPEKGKGFLPVADCVITLRAEKSGRIVQIDCCESLRVCLEKKIVPLR